MHVHTFILITLVLCDVFYSIYLYYGNNLGDNTVLHL